MKLALRMVAVVVIASACLVTSCDTKGSFGVERIYFEQNDISINFRRSDGIETFSTLFPKDINDIPYIELDSIISIKLTDTVDRISLHEQILNTDGTPKFDEKLDLYPDYKYNSEENEISFVVLKNPAVSFSSDINDYKLGQLIRGFTLDLYENDKSVKYCFVIRTDPTQKENE